MGHIELNGAPVSIDLYGGNAIEPQEDEIHKIFLGKGLTIQVSMDKTKSAQPLSSGPVFRQVGNVERARTADKHGFDCAVPGNEKSYLTTGFVGEVGKVSGKFG
jgi:hypothetical protein